ncbi:hypoxia-inducible factor 1-alpha inhibitor-like [Oscarella lobularis]|uniref:hypoxia-inducible factor 1-alpha inhibitor-like n=1 Tax=Oscarella lobularis TaxID=121494 RepID=UPI003313E1AD
MKALAFVVIFALFHLISSDSEDVRRLVEERDLLREQVKSLRDEIKLHSSSRDESCDYLQNRIDDLQRTVKAKRDEKDTLKIGIETAKKEMTSLAKCKADKDSTGKYHKSQIRFQGKYHFPVKPIKRAKMEDPETLKSLQEGLPIVITGSNLTSSALRWNIEFLGKELKNQFVRIFVSSNRQFRYHNMKFETTAAYYEWQPPFRIHEGLFQEFIEMTNDFKKADNGSRAYFQYLINELNLTESMDDDFNEFNWNWIHDTVLPATKWGQLKHNLLLVGMNDVSTPVHFDGMENLFSMIYGHKRCILFDPSQYKGLYPFPIHHPHDRQSQVDFDNPNFEMFPRFREVHGYDTILGPGEVLYIPSHWWHYIESERDSMTVSLNFWFYPAWHEKDDQENWKDLVPDAVDQLLVKQEVETLIAESFHPTKVKDVLKEILDKRFDFIEAKRPEKDTVDGE